MDIQKITESLSPFERKILPFLEEPKIVDICKKSNLDKVSVLRALEYLQNKKIVNLSTEKKKIVEIGVNGALYKKKGLPERRLLNLLNEKRIIPMKDAQKESKLSGDEFKVSLGVLKRKALIELKNGKIIFNASKEEISKKSLEEQFIDALPLDYDSLTPEQSFALKNLQNRRNIIQIEEHKKVSISVTALGKELMSSEIKVPEMIEQITPELIKKESNWKGKKFRRYDVSSPVPEISGGKRHFVNQALDYARKIWIEMGFQEMTGPMIQSRFWNFDALFTAQDHPVREMQDTFFLDESHDLLDDKKLIQTVKETHENGIDGSKGWDYEWNEELSKSFVLRTHTTCLSAAKKEKENFFLLERTLGMKQLIGAMDLNFTKQKELSLTIK
jgi:phenylalanyl-tRNA synthetase alpha chain